MTSSLDSLIAVAERLALVPALAAKRAADAIRELVGEEFDEGRDPYGTAWKPIEDVTLERRQVSRDPTPLTDTTGLRESLNVYARADGHGVALEIGRPGHPAAPHQDGWAGSSGTGPARPILPGRGMPDSWEAAIEEAVTEAIEEEVGRAVLP
jgi:phage gpG-like protein